MLLESWKKSENAHKKMSISSTDVFLHWPVNLARVTCSLETTVATGQGVVAN